MNREQNRWKMGSLIAPVLFLIFAVCVLAVLLTGADVYKRLVDRDQTSYDQRTAVSFLATKVRQADSLDMVTVRKYEGQDVLVLSEEIDGSRYETWIYCYDGYIRELFAASGAGLPLDAGDKVLAMKALSFAWEEDRVLRADVTALDGTVRSFNLTLRSGEEVGV